MNPAHTAARPALALLAALHIAALASSCAPAVAVADEPAHPSTAPATCVVDARAGMTSLVAVDDGVVFATAGKDGLVVERMRGAGCDLAREGELIAATALLDADDAGNVYVFPRATKDPALVSTMLPDENPESMVARVDAHGAVSKLLPAGRGIWDFGVSPKGDALWVTACGPNGIFAVDGDAVTPSLPPPATLWQQMPSVLTNASTFWSVGDRTCAPAAPLDGDCGFALVRTDDEHSKDVAATVVDFGAGFEQAVLRRCGSNVCGVFASAVRVWGDDGSVLATITRDDLGTSSSEQIVDATGNRRGVYVHLSDGASDRVVFVQPRLPSWL